MKLRKNKKIFTLHKTLVSILTISGLTLIVTSSFAAGNASLTMEPASSSQQINSTFNISVYENSGDEQMSTVEAIVNFDSSKLQYISSENGSWDYCNKIPSTGSLKITCAKLGEPYTGKRLINTISFKALAGSESTSLTFGSNSLILRTSDTANIWNTNPVGATISFTTPTTVTNNPTTNNNSTPTTSSPTSSNSRSSTTPKTSTTSPAPATNPVPTTTAPATAPVELTAETANNNTLSYLVAIIVSDDQSRPIPEAKVTLGDKTVNSDALGVASFNNVKAGNYKVKVSSDLGNVNMDIKVENNAESNGIQQFNVKVKKRFNMPFVFGVILLITAIILVLGKLLLPTIKEIRRPKPSGDTNLPPKTTTMEEDIKIAKVKQMGEFVPIMAVPEIKKAPTAELAKPLNSPVAPNSSPQEDTPKTLTPNKVSAPVVAPTGNVNNINSIPDPNPITPAIKPQENANQVGSVIKPNQPK